MVKKMLRKQWSENFYKFLLRTAFVIVGIIGAVQVSLQGAGTRSAYTPRGWKGRAVSLLRKLEDQGYGEQVKWFCVFLFVAIAVYALAWDIKSILHIFPRLSKLGRSIQKQAARGENFRELCSQIDHDMEGGYKEFGAGVYISSSWILEEEAMRLNRIKKITKISGFGKNGLLLEDIDGNQMKLDFIFEKPTREALDYLKVRLPLAEIVADGSISMGYGAGEEKRNMHTKNFMSWQAPKTKQEVEQYAKGAAFGDAAAQREYGKCLLFGKGTDIDEKQAFLWLEKAAAQSDEIAKMYVGHCKLYGLGTKKEEEDGYVMLDNALNYNYPEESSSQPLADYSQFSEEDLCQLFWDLGDALEKGLGVYRNYKVAVYYFEMLDEWGHPEGGERRSHYKKNFLGKWKKVD